ncbi:hypothetical protein PTSG_06742 [Salpingoeca rosetta]|uniref:Uncharacterized protein n=1 Tax=Salpingoeca rosetta (strain ATCC 50818 / BSB-021) TaxID=946362 RepID=F2UEN6_SALR5|nr:uncharacterized protein PTSG_06742 [Salpingoeca rosetta]EGD75086.1 hypothetical protein PTSG_06742 [Salpingoeca rosetta]|eukprot:XP_004992139.1 hypothetical protein PTSG_06742 [Salpingoeca rosetta]
MTTGSGGGDGQWERFQAFVGRVRERLDATGCTLPVAQALSEAEEALADAKREYLKKKIMCDLVRDIVNEDSAIDRPRTQRHNKTCDTAGRLFHAACAQHMSRVDPTTNIRLFGLDTADLTLECDDETRRVVSQTLGDIMSSHLTKVASSVVRMHHSTSERDAEGLLVAKSKQLPALLREEKAEMGAAEAPTRQLLLQHIDALKQLMELQVQHLKTLEHILLKFRIGLHDGDFTFAAGQTVRAKWLIVRSRKARYSLRLCMQDILDKTYTEHTIPQLQSIHAELHRAYEHAAQQHHALTAALEEYNALPAEFREIAREYQDVQQDIAALMAVPQPQS